MDANEQQLVERLTRVGSDDPAQAAHSELTEDLPQLAYARLERLVRTNLLSRREHMEGWWSGLQATRDDDPGSASAAAAAVVAKCLAAGVTLEELGVVVQEVAAETVFGFAYLLGDPWDDELGDPSDLPSWQLCEVASEDEGGELTGRSMDALHEYFGPDE